MSKEELKEYLAEIIELERKRYEVSLAITKLKKKRNTYEYALTGGSCAMAVFIRKRIRALDRKISQLTEKYKKTEHQLQKMYKDDIIYPKYQKQLPVSRFYEYISSGRCTRLEGYGGAYNLYENEQLAKQALQYKNCRGSGH